MKILVTGGAGYIGSFMVRRLIEENYDVVVVDSLERGHKEIVDSKATLEVGNLLDTAFLEDVFSKHSFDGIIHFAGFISVGESMEHPDLYFQNNTHATFNLAEAAVKHNVKKIIFSSTAAVYGDPIKTPIAEDHPKNPTSVYGESKYMVERMLQWYQKVHGLNFVALRYFNACGADLEGRFGEMHEPETHIIPNAIKALLHNQPFTLFGDDYNTADGTCVRDYIHVLDLVEAHVLSLKKLQIDQGGFAYNVGTGNGFSNKEIIAMIKKVSGKELDVTISPRRTGDADSLVADATNIKTDLSFAPQHSDLETIVKSAWAWHTKKN